MNSGTEISSAGKLNLLIIDTGCTDHIVTQKEVKLNLKNEKEKEMVLRNLHYVPNYEVNLLSVNRCIKFGHKFMFNKNDVKLMSSHGPQVDLIKESGLFHLRITFQGSSECHSTTHNTSKAAIKGGIDLWHQRLGHLNKDDVKRTIGCEDNLKEACETYALGKQSSKPVPKETKNKAQKLLELVHSDILGLFEVHSLNGSRYVIIFTDEC